MRALLAAFTVTATLSPALAWEDPPPAQIPTLPETATSAESFAPAGWKVEAQASGDLDGDRRPDIAFVLHGADPKLVIDNKDGIGGEEIDNNPRILGVAVAAENGFRLLLQNTTLIPRRTEPNIVDAFEADGGLTVERGSVKVAISLFASAGGWGMSNVTFTMRLDRGTLALIGYDRTDTQRNSGETETVSVNYLRGRMSVAKGRIDEDKLKTVWKKAPAAKGPTIDQIGDGLEFDPRK